MFLFFYFILDHRDRLNSIEEQYFNLFYFILFILGRPDDRIKKQ